MNGYARRKKFLFLYQIYSNRCPGGYGFPFKFSTKKIGKIKGKTFTGTLY
jgi:hypothetical protein